MQMSQAPSIRQHLTHKARNQIAVGMVLETSIAKMEVTQCQVRNKILRMRTIPNTEPATASRDSNNNPLQRMATATGNSNHFKGGQKPETATVSRIGNNSQGTASAAVTGRRVAWKYEKNKSLQIRIILSRLDYLTKFERSRSYGLTRKEIRTGKYSRLLNKSHH